MQPLSLMALLCWLSCNLAPNAAPYAPATETGRADTLPDPVFQQPEHDYAASRALVEKCRKACKAAYTAGNLTLDSVGRVFTTQLLSEITPHWYGTSWSFSGHTETPKAGSIACGYFVSTTLLHAGLNLNRYTLAQQGPCDEALMLSLGDTIRVTRCSNAGAALECWRNRLRDGLYFIGLEGTHVGFLLKRGTGLYFLHSNYAGQREVQLQSAEESVLMGFRTFYLADLTFNRRLMEHWLRNAKVELEKNGVVATWQL